MKAQIVSDLPLPTEHASGYGRASYPFKDLVKVGQALIFPADTDYRKLARAAHAHARRYNWFAAVRRLPDGTIAVWRAQDGA